MTGKDARIFLSVDTGDLRADLDAIELGLGKKVGKVIKEAAGPIAREAQGLAPYDPLHRTDRKDGLGHVRDSIRVGNASALTATIVSTHPAAPIFEWNDGIRAAIAPRGVPLTLRAVAMAHKAAEHQAARLERDVQDGINSLVARYFPA